MKTPQTSKQRQKKRRDSLKVFGVTRMTLSLDKTTAQILRSLALEHRVTQSDILHLAVKLARKAFLDGMPQPPRSASPVPVAPSAALATIAEQLAELQDEQDEVRTGPTAAEARALALFGGEAFEVRP